MNTQTRRFGLGPSSVVFTVVPIDNRPNPKRLVCLFVNFLEFIFNLKYLFMIKSWI